VLERRDFPGGVAALVSTRLESSGFLAAFTERTGGVSTGSFRSLNLGLGSGDEVSLVRENRRRVREALSIAPFASGHQVHGAHVAHVDPSRAGAGFEDAGTNFPRTDALVTSWPGLPLAVIAADCVPVALADPRAGRLAVVHAGWRGVAAGIIEEAMRAFDAPERLGAAIGPAVGADHYEVGEDVASAVLSAADGDAVLVRSGSTLCLDLPGTVEGILRRAGVRQIERARACTACEPERFFSHRRDGPCGRQALVAVRLA
jgi:purine-nucleoside/S-methyl-5'-thioadenosine phosphorylase / adenosine deaminase